MFRPNAMSESYLAEGVGQPSEASSSNGPQAPSSAHTSTHIPNLSHTGSGQQTVGMNSGAQSQSQDHSFSHQAHPSHLQPSYNPSRFPPHSQMVSTMLPPLPPSGPASAPSSYGGPLMSVGAMRQRVDYPQFSRKRSLSPRGEETTMMAFQSGQSNSPQYHLNNYPQSQTFVAFPSSVNPGAGTGAGVGHVQMQVGIHSRPPPPPQLQSPVQIGGSSGHQTSTRLDSIPGRMESIWNEDETQPHGLGQPPSFASRTPKHQTSAQGPPSKVRRLSAFEFSAPDLTNIPLQTTPTSGVYSNYPPRGYFMANRLSPRSRGQRSKRPFTPEEDAKLISLKESGTLTWRQIAEQFDERSSGTLQVRYCTKLKEKTRRWTTQMETKLISLLKEYHNNRWRVMASRMGSGFSASTCRLKALELGQDGRLGEDCAILGVSSFDISDNEADEPPAEPGSDANITAPSAPPSIATGPFAESGENLQDMSPQPTTVCPTPTEGTKRGDKEKLIGFSDQKRTHQQLHEAESESEENETETSSGHRSFQISNPAVPNIPAQPHEGGPSMGASLSALTAQPSSSTGIASSGGHPQLHHLHRFGSHSVGTIPPGPNFHPTQPSDGATGSATGTVAELGPMVPIQHDSSHHGQHPASHPPTPIFPSQNYYSAPGYGHTGGVTMSVLPSASPSSSLAQSVHRPERQPAFHGFPARHVADGAVSEFRHYKYPVDGGRSARATKGDAVADPGPGFGPTGHTDQGDGGAGEAG